MFDALVRGEPLHPGAQNSLNTRILGAAHSKIVWS